MAETRSESAIAQDLYAQLENARVEADKKVVAILTYVLADVHRLMTETDAVSYADGGQATTRINARREKLNIPAVPRLRIIDFSSPSTQTVHASTGTGSPRRPHFRRGTWRNLRSGRQVWVRAAAIHGGGDDPPPWYEIRT